MSLRYLHKQKQWNILMTLNGQHSVNCFRYVPMAMHFKINSVPDSLRKASRLDVFVDKSTWMVMFLLLSCDVLGSELPWNCIIKHHKDNYHKVVPFSLIHIVLFIRIMRDYALICELCDRMWFLINYAGSHHHTLSEALFTGEKISGWPDYFSEFFKKCMSPEFQMLWHQK